MFFICKLFFFRGAKKTNISEQPFNCLPLVRAGGGKKRVWDEERKSGRETDERETEKPSFI